MNDRSRRDAEGRAPEFLRLAMGNMGKSALASTMEVYALFYCTEVLGIDPRSAGLIILASLLWDALADPLVGVWADRQLVRRPTVARLLLLGMPLAAGAFLAFFHLHLLPAAVRPGAAIVALIAFRAAYTLVDVPHNSLLVFAARHSTDRKRLASQRILFSALGKVCLTATAAWWLSVRASGPADAIPATAFAMVAVFGATLAICTASVRAIRPPPTAGAGAWRPLTSLRALFGGTPDLRLALLMTAINSATIPAVGVALIYGARYQLGNTEIGAKALIVQAAMQAVMPLVWDRLSGSAVPVPRLLALAYAGLFAVSALACLLPPGAAMLFLLAAGSGAAMAGIFMLNWVFFSDALAEARRSVPTDATLSAFGVYAVVNKIGHGLAQALSGAIVAVAMSSGPARPGGENPSLLVPLLVLVAAGALAAGALSLSRRPSRDAADGRDGPP